MIIAHPRLASAEPIARVQGHDPDAANERPAAENVIMRHEAEQIRIHAALGRLRLACELVDMAGRGLAPFIATASGEALLELSVELGRIESLLARRTLGADP